MMKVPPLRRSAPLIALLLMLGLVTYAFALINPDGDPTDWGSISPVVTDPNEPLIADTADIKTLYMLQEGKWLSLRLDTHAAPTDYGTGATGSPYAMICLDIDSNPGTGQDVENCDMTGVEYAIFLDMNEDTGTFRSRVRACTSPTQQNRCEGAIVGSNLAGRANEVSETRISLSYLGFPPGSCTGTRTFAVGAFFDGGSTAPDDNAPDTGTISFTIDCSTLAVTMDSFTATGTTSDVKLEWTTVSELDNLGFNLYRATSADGEQVKLNSDLIPSQASGSSTGASYEYGDATVEAGTTYFYWLESVDLSGATERFGPVSAELMVPTAVTLGTFAGQNGSVVPMVALGVGALALVAGFAVRRRNR